MGATKEFKEVLTMRQDNIKVRPYMRSRSGVSAFFSVLGSRQMIESCETVFLLRAAEEWMVTRSPSAPRAAGPLQ